MICTNQSVKSFSVSISIKERKEIGILFHTNAPTREIENENSLLFYIHSPFSA